MGADARGDNPIREIFWTRTGLLLLVLVVVSGSALGVSTVMDAGTVRNLVIAVGTGTLIAAIVGFGQTLITANATHRAMVTPLIEENRRALQELSAEYRSLNREFFPTHVFEPTDSPNPAFNRLLMQDLQASRQFLFRGFSGRHAAARLLLARGDRELRAVVAEPTERSAIIGRARYLARHEGPGADIDAIELGLLDEIRMGRRVRRLCTEAAAHLPFHGWHHVQFVRNKAVQFAAANGADASVVEAAALVHDVNYLVRRASSAGAGRGLRGRILTAAWIPVPVVHRIEEVVTEAEMRTRHRHISLEAQALSDADTLFKALPITPVVLAHRYLAENGVTLRELADKIVGEQRPVHDEGFYFYDPTASATYARWASANLELWSCIRESLDDPNVTQLLASVP